MRGTIKELLILICQLIQSLSVFALATIAFMEAYRVRANSPQMVTLLALAVLLWSSIKK